MSNMTGINWGEEIINQNFIITKLRRVHNNPKAFRTLIKGKDKKATKN